MQNQITKGFRLSPQQKRVWSLQQDSLAYCVQCALLLEGHLKPEILKDALQKVVNQQKILRTAFRHLSGIKTPVMVIADNSRFLLDTINLIDLQLEEQNAEIDALCLEQRHQDFDLEQGSIWRSLLLTLSATKHVLIVTLPSLCGDAWTLKNLVAEISRTYSACLQGEEVSEPVVQYVQFSEWQNQLLEDDDAEAGKEYWKQQDFSNANSLNLPFEGKSWQQSKFEPSCLSVALGSDVLGKIEALGQQYDTSVSVVLLTCWQILLWRVTGQSDIIVGTIYDRREGEYEPLHNVLGLLATWLPIKIHVVPDLRFTEALELVKKATGDAEDWQDYFSWNDDRITSPIGFEWVEWLDKWSSAGISFSLYKQYTWIEPFKVKLTCIGSNNSLSLDVYYDTNLFSADAIQHLSRQFQRLLTSATENPDTAISHLEILTPSDRQQLLVEFNQTQIDYPLDKCIHQWFEEQVQKIPNNIAVVFEDQHLTYAELNRKANQLAHTLQQRGVKPEVVVGLWVERSVEMIVGLLGILKAGGAYLPLDPALPIEGLTFRLQDAQVPILLTQQQLAETLPTLATQVICLDMVAEASRSTDWNAIAQQSDANPSSEVTSKSLVYVIYTSGSTGKPKGVAIEHRQLLNYLNGIINKLDLPKGASFATVSTFAADLGNTAIFPALCTGGCLHIISQERATNPEAFADYCDHHPIDCLKIVPSHLKALLSASHPEKILPKKHLILGGEALSWTLVEKLQKYALNCQIVNHYGPTEATIGVLTYSIEDESIQERSQTVPIGRPLANTQVYILDEYLQPVPMGVGGELYIGGNNLARGYLNQPELTNERFIPNLFSDESESRLYKTGDLARYLPDGTIEFLGRIDNQIKIRGFRIEPGEIESVLRQNPEVQDVVVLVREDDPGGTRLVAYVIPRQGKTSNSSELRHFLKEKLPEYMVPSAFVLLKNLPLTPNGKVDRQALLSLEMTRPDLDGAFVAPRTPVEESLARIWAELLGLEQVGVHDNFFELGGHSLLLTQVVSRLRDTFEMELPLSDFFEAPTVADLAVIITQRLAEETDNVLQTKIKPQSRNSSTFPLSFAQARLWFLDQLEPGNPFYNQSAAVHLSGVLNLAALEQSFNEILRRHEVLRTTFTVVEEQPVQVIAPTLTLTVPVVDLQELPEAERKAEVLRLFTQEAQRSFHLSEGPLLRCTLLRLDETEYVLLFTMHHIISDAWSKGVLLRELAILYEAFSTGKPSPLPQLPIQYADFAVWQQQWLQGEVLETQLTYWRQQLEGSPPLLELPTDRTRPPVQTFRGATQSLILPKALTAALKALSKQEDVTLFMTLLAAFKTLLYRYTGQNDILVGSPIANRNRSEIEGLIGFFVNTLVMRTNLGDSPSFRELLSRVRQVALGAYAHQDLPFERLVNELQLERDLSHTPLFQVMFEFGNTPLSALELPGLTLSLLETDSSTAKFDLSLSMRETEQGLIGSLEYNTDLFDAGTIARMLGHFQTLVASILTNPDQRLEDLQLLTEAEQQQLLVEWNDTGADYPQNQCIHQLFEAQVEQTPDAVAVVFEEQQLTYRELNARANQLAHHLQKLGVEPEVLVGICVERSLEMVVGLLGILKAGGAYVPLDPGYPQERLVFMLEDANVPVLLTREKLVPLLPEYEAKVVYLDADWEESTKESDRNPISQVTTQNLAYLIYTSGSTGKPKGVQILHSALVNFLSAMRLTPGLTQEDTLLSVTPLSFDIAALELYLPLIVGARLVVVRREVAADGTELLKQLASSGATVMQATPATWRMLLAAGWEGSGSLKILCGGETLNRELAIQLLERGTELWNLYGPTETTIWSTAYKVDSQKSDVRGGEVISIGRPITNTQLYVLDQDQQPVPVGIIGELHIGGLGLARGYLNRPELTSETFISNPFNSDPASRLYKTGDLVRYRPDGTLEYISRIDYQVKIRGFRIELGEIEAALSQHPAVRETVVLAQEKVQGDKRLIAYIVTEQKLTPSISDLRHFLREKLPEYMVPSVFVPLEALPLTPNGKVNRNALPLSDNVCPDLDVAYVMPRNEVEQTIAKIWQDILGVEQVGIHDNFFELGGHSLLATQVISQMRKAFQVELPLRHLFEAPTVADQAFAIQQKQDEKDTQSLNPISKIERGNAEQLLVNLDQMSEQDVDSLLQEMLAEQEVNS